MSENNEVDKDDFLEENFDENVSVASAQSATMDETSEGENKHNSSDLPIKKKIGFTGADKLSDDDRWLQTEQLLRSANIEGKMRQEIYENLQEKFPHRKRNAKKSLFEDNFTPKPQPTLFAENVGTQNTRLSSAYLSPGFGQGFPWANDLSKISIPKLKSTNEEAIMCFQSFGSLVLRAPAMHRHWDFNFPKAHSTITRARLPWLLNFFLLGGRFARSR